MNKIKVLSPLSLWLFLAVVFNKHVNLETALAFTVISFIFYGLFFVSFKKNHQTALRINETIIKTERTINQSFILKLIILTVMIFFLVV